jgi:zinc protease
MKRRSELPRALPALLLVFFLLPSLAAVAAEERLGPHLFLVRDKPGTPTHFQMIVGAGCVDEVGANCRGLAHYLEHLVLVGRNPEHKEIALRFFPDGSSNGWTSQRATVYVHSIPGREEGPRADLERLFGFYAARLKDFYISDADAERERNVVRQERDWRVGSKPIVRLARKLDRLLLPDHPAGQSVIGTSEDIDAFKLDDARAFHRAWYAINNVDFVVMADIDPAVLKDIAERALAGLEPRPLPPRTFAKPPAIVEGRTDIVEQDATIQRPVVFFKKLIRVEEDDAYATGAARTLVMNFLTSRLPGSLYDVVVDKGRLAAGAPSISLARVASKTFVLSIGAEAAQDVAPETVLTAITAYVGQLEPASLSAATLARLQTRFAEGRAAADKDPRQVYNRLVGWLAGRSRYEQLASWPQRVAAVSPEQTAVVLKALSGPGRIVTGTLVPVDGRP